MDSFFTEIFTDDYVRQEIEWYGLNAGELGDVKIETHEISGRIDDYLSKTWRVGGIHAPVLRINGSTWMSLTPMEIQSAAYALSQITGGVIGTGGLGMGYFTLRAAQMEEVERIDVYEINEDVIWFFQNAFKGREGFDKINIIKGDIRQTLHGKRYDLFFNDIYQTMLPDDVIDDIENFTENNNIETYMFWGYELAVWAGSQQDLFGNEIDVGVEDISIYLRYYFRGFASDSERLGLAKTGWDLPEPDYVAGVLQAMANAHDGSLP